MNEYFKEQLAGGATDNWFYGTEHDGVVKIERHSGAIDSLRLTGLEFDRMMGSTPFFRPCVYDEQSGEQGWECIKLEWRP